VSYLSFNFIHFPPPIVMQIILKDYICVFR